MNSKIIITTIIILLFSVCYIFIVGNLKYQKASEETTNLGFKNSHLSLNLNDFQVLEAIIENKSNKKTNFLLSFFINNQEIAKEEISLLRYSDQIISPPDELKNYIINNRDNLNNFRYEIKVIWNDKEDSLYKILTK